MALINFDDDPWFSVHDKCEKLCRDILTNILTWRENFRHSKSGEYGTRSSNIRFQLGACNSEIQKLKELLETKTRSLTITDEESERRSRQIEVLQSRYVHLQRDFSNGVQSFSPRNDSAELRKNKEELFAGSSNPQGGKMQNVRSVNWGTESDDEDLLDVSNGNAPIQQLNHQQIVKEQDRGLEELSKVISRQKNIAHTIGNEVSFQNEIIDDLADRIDRTDSRVRSETGEIRSISLNDSTCGLWTLIIILFIAIILVGILL